MTVQYSTPKPPPSSVMVAEYFAHPYAPKKVLDKNEACLSCRRRKTKCDGIRPTCGTCSRLEKTCIFPAKDPKESMQQRVRRLSHRGSGISGCPIGMAGGTGLVKIPTIPLGRTSLSTKAQYYDPTIFSLRNSYVQIPNDSIIHNDRTTVRHSAEPLASEQSIGSILKVEERPATARDEHCVPIANLLSSEASPSEEKPATLLPSQARHHHHHDQYSESFAFGAGGFHHSEIFNNGRRGSLVADNYGIPSLKGLYTAPEAAVNAPISHSGGTALQGQSTCRMDISTGTTRGNIGHYHPHHYLARGEHHRVAHFPQIDIINGLIDLFFLSVHHILPCLDERQFKEDVSTVQADNANDPTALLYAVLGLAAQIHPDIDIRGLSVYWNLSAKAIIQNAIADGKRSTMFVKAILWNSVWSFCSGDFAEASTGMANAYKMALELGLYDASDRNHHHHHKEQSSWYGSTTAASSSSVNPAKREVRSLLWAIYRFDQALSLCYNPPLGTEGILPEQVRTEKCATSDTLPGIPHIEPFKLSKDFSSSSFGLGVQIILHSSACQDSNEQLNHVVLLVDKIRAFHSSNSGGNSSSRYAEEFSSLETLLTCYRLSFLPSSRTNSPAASPTSLTAAPVNWKGVGHSGGGGGTTNSANTSCHLVLQIMLHAATILLYNPRLCRSCSQPYHDSHMPSPATAPSASSSSVKDGGVSETAVAVGVADHPASPHSPIRGSASGTSPSVTGFTPQTTTTTNEPPPVACDGIGVGVGVGVGVGNASGVCATSLTNAAAEGILSIIKSVTDLRSSTLLNPLLVPVYHILGKVLLGRSSSEIRGGMERAKADAVVVALVLSRIGEEWGDVGFRYKDMLLAEIQMY